MQGFSKSCNFFISNIYWDKTRLRVIDSQARNIPKYYESNNPQRKKALRIRNKITRKILSMKEGLMGQ
jgi:hypothetical protein